MHRKIVKIEYLMHSNFPLNQQMLNMLAMLLDTEILAKLIHCSMFIMSAIILFLTAKKFFSIDIALLSSIVFYAIPMLAFNSWTCGNDAALTFYFCLFLNAALNYLDSSDAKILAFCGLLAGACIAVKYTGIFSVSGLCAILVLFIILKKEKLKIKLKKLFWFFIFLIMPMMPWLIKNYIFVNNPIYPFLYSIFGDYQLKEFGGGGNIMNTPLNIFTFSFKKIFLVFWNNTNNEPIGIIFISLLPLIFLYLHKNKKLLILFLGFIISYFLWFLGTPQFRYILPCFAILSILIAYSFSELSNKIKSLYLLMAVLVIINFFCYNTALYKNIKIADYYLAKENKDEYLSKQRALYPVPPYPAIKWINDNLADTALILFIGESRPFYMQRKYISYSVENNRQPLIEYLKKSNNSGEFYDLLKLKKITHFLVNYKEAIRVNKGYDTFYWDDKDRKIFKEFWDNHIKLLYFKKSVYVYEIVEKNSDQKVDNLLEILSIYGWHNKILYDYFYSKNMYLNLIDELEVYQDAGFDCAQQIRYFKNQI
ncbi:MAG TPA: glycosyltransferase family 39 protein, partial [bacterium]|nr:glycosyltransferase family 39 protein [bacterium]